jgi:ATP-dependent Lon protease
MGSENKQQKRQIPIVAIRGSVVFPHTDAVLSFGRKKSVAAVNSAFQENRVMGIFTQKDARTPDPTADDLYKMGTIVTITQMMSTEGEIHAIVRGQARIKLLKMVENEPYLIGKVEEYQEAKVDVSGVEVLANKIKELFKRVINLGKQTEIMTVMKLVSGKVEPGELADQVASILELKTSKKQELLETLSLKKRLTKVHQYLAHEVNVLELERTISTKTQKKFEDQMRRAVLREKKKTIEEELGEIEEGDLGSEELKEYRKKIKAAHMPKEVKLKANKELKRLSQLSPHNPEGGYIRNYLDWLTDMPWRELSPNNVSIKHAAKVLEEDHYGLKKVKERILEYLAVMKVKKSNAKTKKLSKKKATGLEEKDSESQPTILCFIGPPGVGKTSIGKSIARALGRKFVRMSLGGIRDEAEIRGHRRTYVGALPGRIIQGIKNAGTRNPVFMLDEIDKLGIDFRGDPSSALLEALDPEQNKEFSDHYLEIPFDLSQVMFICTGNVLETMPHALRDRMEIIKFPGYTQDEKYHIADQFLWPKQLRLHGLKDLGLKRATNKLRKLKIRGKQKKQIEMSEKAINEIINRYTREAGVRNLERNLATVCRKMARLVAEKKKYPKTLKVTDIRRFLGPQKFTSLIAEKKDEVGMATGLAVTASGGEILFIEVSLMPGKGKLTLTGQLGDVMKESCKAAFTWARSHWQELGLKESFGRKIDVHIHVPEGAVPKDGPSAGIAMATALVSALTGIPTRRDVGMTGEVTLRGRVLEIGGVKEKVIAGHRAGLRTIVLSKDNKKDLEDIPKRTKNDIKFVFTSNLDEVLKVALKKWPVVKKAKKRVSPTRPTYLATA